MNKQSVNYQPVYESRRSVLLLIVLLSGVAAGQVIGAFTSNTSYNAVFGCLQMLTQTQVENNIPILLRTAFLYFRSTIALFFFGYYSIGMPLVLLLSAIEAFSLSFSIAVFAKNVGAMVSVALFGIRCIFLFPALVYLGSTAIQSAFRNNRDSLPLIGRTVVTIFWLSIGTVLELIFVPLFLKMFPFT